MMARLMSTATAGAVMLLAGVALQGCNGLPGKPKPGPEVVRPEAILDFPTLYRQNCSGCHGAKGMDGSSYPLANPEYQALVDDSTLRTVIAQGKPGSLMPAFAKSAGGTLTDTQVDALVTGMRAAWYRPDAFAGAKPPPYQSTTAANAAAGQQVYSTYCASCHGIVSMEAGNTPGAGLGSGQESAHAGKAGSVTQPAFLALVSDQALRTIIIAGRPDLGQPDWKSDLAGRAMSDQEVTDVVSWLSSQRPGADGSVSSANSASHAPPAEKLSAK